MPIISTPEGQIHYQTTGQGRETYLIFHGFGQNMSHMLAFEHWRTEDQKFIFIDFFHHGKSRWKNSNRKLTLEIWRQFITQLQSEESFKEFHLIGYSMGGKVSLLTFEIFGNLVKSLTLLAPDGIKTGLWYSMNSYPTFVHDIFKQVVFKPNRFFGLVNGLQTVGLVEKSLGKFIQTQMETRSQRAQAYLIWKIFSHLQPDLGLIIRLSRQHKLPIHLFVGKFDKMVTEANLRHFATKIPSLQTHILPVGHGGLIEATVDFFLKSESNQPR
jgi:pimeloyl-ACP methyl ester carboxylesterase